MAKMYYSISASWWDSALLYLLSYSNHLLILKVVISTALEGFHRCEQSDCPVTFNMSHGLALIAVELPFNSQRLYANNL